MPLFFYLKLLCLEITEKNIQIYFCKHGVYIKCICSQIKCNKKASKYIIANTVSNVNVHIWFPKINNKHIIQQPNTRVYPKEIFIKAQFFSRKKTKMSPSSLIRYKFKEYWCELNTHICTGWWEKEKFKRATELSEGGWSCTH